MVSDIEFDKLIRMVQRQQNVSEPVPPFYIRTLVNLESSLNAAIAKEKEAKKKMNASNARAMTAMKQKVKKIVKEYEKEITQFQEVCCIFFSVHCFTSQYFRTQKHLSVNTLHLR